MNLFLNALGHGIHDMPSLLGMRLPPRGCEEKAANLEQLVQPVKPTVSMGHIFVKIAYRFVCLTAYCVFLENHIGASSCDPVILALWFPYLRLYSRYAAETFIAPDVPVGAVIVENTTKCNT